MPQSLNKTVIVDIGIPQLGQNFLFDPIVAGKISHTILPWCYLYKRAKAEGIKFITPDVYFDSKDKPKEAFLISHMVTSNTFNLIKAGVKPIIIISQESPINAYRFYFFLRKFISQFDHAFLFEGFRQSVNDLKTKFHTLYFPQPYSPNIELIKNWRNKKYLSMISGNKRAPLTLKRFITSLFSLNFYKGLYQERLAAIEYFSNYDDFDLYGIDWGKPQKWISGHIKNCIKKCYRGITDDKIETFKKYKFSLIFENTVSKGYVTEKIFDAFFAGAVPIYYGAPDIENYIPKNTFIDFRQFKNYAELDKYLRSINEITYNHFIENIYSFIKSEYYYKFSQEKFANDVLSILRSYF